VLGPVSFDAQVGAACIFDELADQQFGLAAAECQYKSRAAIEPRGGRPRRC
jgi:hypothetical protein